MSDIIATFPQTSSPAVNARSSHASRPPLGRQASTRTIQHSSPRQAPPPTHAMDSATAEATCKKLVSILALAAGFEGITASALESLTRSFENYTQQMYSIAHSFAELAGRTRPNIHDLQQAFSDMNVNPASLESYARKASHSSTPLLRGPLQETLAKKEQKKEKKTDLLDSDIEDNSDSDEEDEKEKQAAGPKGAKITARTVVPDHLPAFPSKHSYKQTPVFVTRPTDPQAIRELNAEQSRLVETNLKRLMAAENKVAMAAHKDTLQQDLPVAELMTTIKEENSEEVESQELRELRSRVKLEVLPVVNYEYSKRSSSTVIREPGSKSHSDLAGGDADVQVGSGQGSKAEWRKERRRLRKEKIGVLEEMEPNNGTHKRIRSDASQGVRSSSSLHGSSMDLDRQQ